MEYQIYCSDHKDYIFFDSDGRFYKKNHKEEYIRIHYSFKKIKVKELLITFGKEINRYLILPEGKEEVHIVPFLYLYHEELRRKAYKITKKSQVNLIPTFFDIISSEIIVDPKFPSLEVLEDYHYRMILTDPPSSIDLCILKGIYHKIEDIELIYLAKDSGISITGDEIKLRIIDN